MDWVILTRGERAAALESALTSLMDPASAEIVVVDNGGSGAPLALGGVRPVVLETNVGVPGGRDVGLRRSHAHLVGFLDDDAEFRGEISTVHRAFAADQRLGAVSFRLVDEQGLTARRHVPRAGAGRPGDSGEVAYFLGGACAIRREAYEEVGGYFTELFYGHEEIELSWRLIDAGWTIRYLADVEVFHPRTEISRHADGWYLTGRNRVWIARRTLPWPVAALHVASWLILGMIRAPRGSCRDAYRRGWVSGWTADIAHRPISWRTVWRLTRLGRPPII
jgi:GT2 family glycosyltransferase